MLNVYYIGPYLYIEREIIVDSQDHSMIKTVKKNTHTKWTNTWTKQSGIVSATSS